MGVVITDAISAFDGLQRQRTTLLAKLAAIQATRPEGAGSAASSGPVVAACAGSGGPGSGGPDDDFDADLGCGAWGEGFAPRAATAGGAAPAPG